MGGRPWWKKWLYKVFEWRTNARKEILSSSWTDDRKEVLNASPDMTDSARFVLMIRKHSLVMRARDYLQERSKPRFQRLLLRLQTLGGDSRNAVPFAVSQSMLCQECWRTRGRYVPKRLRKYMRRPQHIRFYYIFSISYLIPTSNFSRPTFNLYQLSH